jgi:O-methyltransferase
LNSEWFDNVCQSALGHRSSQEQTYDLARLVLQRGIPGDFVECGVYAGASCALMARALMDEAEETYGECGAEKHPSVDKRCVHLFDSFAGIPKPGPHDIELAANRGGESACSLEDVQFNMKHWGIPDELLHYWKGDLDLMVSVALDHPHMEAIALLRLDADLYTSTRAAMRLYPLVSPGGYVIVDDFNLSGCRKAVLEYFEPPNAPAPVVWRKPK